MSCDFRCIVWPCFVENCLEHFAHSNGGPGGVDFSASLTVSPVSIKRHVKTLERCHQSTENNCPDACSESRTDLGKSSKAYSGCTL